MNDTEYFVPNATFDGRQATAEALVGAADEFGFDQREIRTTSKGFFISERLANAVFEDGDGVDDGSVPDDGQPATEPADDGQPATEPADDAGAEDQSGDSDDKTPEGTPSPEEQTETAPAKKSRSKKNDTSKE